MSELVFLIFGIYTGNYVTKHGPQPEMGRLISLREIDPTMISVHTAKNVYKQLTSCSITLLGSRSTDQGTDINISKKYHKR